MARDDVIDGLLSLPVWPEDPLPTIRQLGSRTLVLALDDDPTGTQTVRDVPVLTRWDADALAGLLEGDDGVAFLLTNSRALPVRDAVDLATRIGRDIRASSAGHPAPRSCSVISRSDSTLRGHFPAEVDALVDAMGVPDARIVLAPFFGDGGRLTVGGTHVLRQAGALVPVAETEFARDVVFGYASSSLPAWVEERIGARAGARPRVARALGLDVVRQGGPDAVRDVMLALPSGGVLCVDAADERDIEVVALGALLAELEGLPVVGRTAASYVRARAGRPSVRPLEPAEVAAGTPGLVVVGSHVPLTSSQLERLLDEPPIPVQHLELPVDDLLAEQASGGTELVGGVAAAADDAIRTGRTPIVATSRTLVRALGPEGDVAIAARVSDALVGVVRGVSTRPAWILAKGGITSSDVATRGLGIDLARVIGPLLPGVPLWRSGPTSRWPGLPLLVFPGNVGGPDALRDAVARLAGVP